MELTNLSWGDVVYLLGSAQYTIMLSLMAFLGGGIAGLFLTICRLAPNRAVRLFARLYIELMEGTPLLMQLFIWFFLLSVFGIDLPATLAAGIALTMNAAAFFADVWRGSIQAIRRTQWEAAASIGMTRLQQIVHIIAPQAFRIALAPTVGLMIQIIKGTSLTALVGFVELTRAGQLVTSTNFQPLQTFCVVALIYLALCLPLSILSQKLERRMDVARPLDIGF